MKQIKIHFEQDSLLSHIEVILRSSAKDTQVTELIQKISGENADSLIVTDIDNISNTIMLNTIFLLSVSGKYVNIITEDTTYIVKQSLQSLENLLNEKNLSLFFLFSPSLIELSS